MGDQLFSDDDYIRYDPFECDRDVDIRCKSVKLVKARKDHVCYGGYDNIPHNVKKGEKARNERAIVDGEWRGYYMCIKCMDDWLLSLVSHG